MNKSRIVVVAVVMLLGAAHRSFAWKNKFGAAADAPVCEADIAKASNLIHWRHAPTDKPGKNTDPVTTEVSAACKAEVDKRAQVCLADAEVQTWMKSAQEPWRSHPDVKCASEAYAEMFRQLEQVKKDAAAAELAKTRAEERKAKAATVQLPKPGKHDASLEKQIATSYSKAFPTAKVLKTLLLSSDWSTERNDFGVIIGRNIQAAVVNQQGDVCEIYNELWQQEYLGNKFSGPMLERGAGSLDRTEIACANVK